jgi:apolipoprotein N-acyltransferase
MTSILLGYLLSNVFSLAYSNYFIFPIISCLYYLIINNKNNNKVLFLFVFALTLYLNLYSWSFYSVNNFTFIESCKCLFGIFLYSLSFSVIGYYLLKLKTKNNFFIIFTTIFYMSDLFRSNFLGGFPQNLFGVLSIDTIFSGLLPVFGELGLTFILILISTIFVDVIVYRSKIKFFLLLIIVFSSSIINNYKWVDYDLKEVSVNVVQTNISSQKKWDKDQFNGAFESIKKNIIQNKQDIIVFPETSFVVSLDQIPEKIKDYTAILKSKNQSLISGGTKLVVKTDKYRNEYSMGFGLGNAYGETYKEQMIPFGDYIPYHNLLDFFYTSKKNSGIIPYEKEYNGDLKINIDNSVYKVGVAICYEIFYSKLLNDRFRESSLIVLISNIADFGSDKIKSQHFQSARARAIEHQKYTLVSTNSGFSGIIDPFGKVISITKPNVEMNVIGKIKMSEDKTPYNLIKTNLLFYFILFYCLFLYIKKIKSEK